MNDYLPAILAAIAALAAIAVIAGGAAIAGGVCWFCYRWGHADGRADGYLSGDTVSQVDIRAVKLTEP